MRLWDDLGAVVLDMDGVIFIGRKLRRGIIELVEHLREVRVAYGVLTNTSSRSSEEIAASLAAMGLDIEPQRITTSSELVADYIQTHGGVRTVFTLGGGSGLASALRARSIKPVDVEGLSFREIEELAHAADRPMQPLILGWTRNYNYELATKVIRVERLVSEIYLAGEDRVFQDETGAMPGIRWLGGSVGALLDKKPRNPAKPNPFALEYVFQKLGQPPEATAVIGDSVSDIEAGNRAGCRTVLLLGGATPDSAVAHLQGASIPKLVIHELTELL